MPYTPTTWTSGVTPLDTPELSNLETQYTEATNSFEQDLFTAFVLSGLVCTKDGTTANQLDVTAGVAFLLQTDSTLRRRATAASTTGQFTTATPSTTYYLDLNPDGTFSWGTSHSGVTNHLTICQATTDGSGNILAVTDERTLNTTLLTALLGFVKIPGLLLPANQIGKTSGGDLLDGTGAAGTYIKWSNGSAGSLFFQSPNGTTLWQLPFVHHSISASGTITHGLGRTPDTVRTECSTTASNTAGHDTLGSTTYHVTLGASQANDSICH